MVMSNPMDAREQERIGVPERSRCWAQCRNCDR